MPSLDVCFHVALVSIFRAAEWTFKWLNTSMLDHMSLQMCYSPKSPSAYSAVMAELLTAQMFSIS